jgi:hypothetical protein
MRRIGVVGLGEDDAWTPGYAPNVAIVAALFAFLLRLFFRRLRFLADLPIR